MNHEGMIIMFKIYASSDHVKWVELHAGVVVAMVMVKGGGQLALSDMTYMDTIVGSSHGDLGIHRKQKFYCYYQEQQSDIIYS